ncbi:MAG: L,D-transpeptidase family protein [bacterium]
MQRLIRLLILMAILVCLDPILSSVSAGPSLSDQVRESLQKRIENANTTSWFVMDKEPIHASVVLSRFYRNRHFQPAWLNDLGPIPQVDSLIKSIREAHLEGLRPEDYHLNKIEEIHKQVLRDQKEITWTDPLRLADLDLLLTDSFLIYGFHLLAGRVDQETMEVQWKADRCEIDLAGVLQAALDTSHIEEALKALIPIYSGYIRLRQALARYRKIVNNGGWPLVPNNNEMRKGDYGKHVTALRNRLIISGDLDPKIHKGADLFDDTLEQAILKFQQRHGLPADGIVGPDTFRELNILSDVRMRQIEMNMERWRWLPHDLGSRYIIVNIADFKAGVFEDDKTVMVMKVVVGKDCRQTPILSGEMTQVILCPYWHIPKKIAIEDKLPFIREDPDYLAKHHIKVFQNCGGKYRKVDPETIDWSSINADNFKYLLSQAPGPWNPLGNIKFWFPNKFEVHLHDTPSQVLFEKNSRTFSSGCIRIEKPIDLAEYLLQEDPEWTRKRIVAAINKNVERIIRIPSPIQIHLIYWTAWTNEDLSMQFRKDIYGRDELLGRLFRE